ncbi:solute carrier family 43 member 3-like isoform X2 [Scyliorhinus canicula]|uniref:solute carrier family 43 member 3-like isoform X2 n=1 Tax=Scyliorhinus canicula TaxID=7830 RepID=UPI0018F3A88E|nr:solute carrier family 43 member 3-like isoform X2 [Scyliorhinus canicula]
MESLKDRCRLYFCFAIGLFECLGFTGVIYGWASLVFVLRKEEYFLDVCDTLHNSSSDGAKNGSTGCDLQDDRFTLVFTIANFVFSFSALPGGVLFDFFGTMVTRILAITVYTAATLMFALSTAATAALLFPVLSLMAIGGIFLFITNIQVANLFGNRRSTIITLYNGALDSSSVVFLLVKVLHEVGLSLMSMFLFISSLSIIHILRTFFVLPRTRIPYPLLERYSYGIGCDTLPLPSFCRQEATPGQIEPYHGTEVNMVEVDGRHDEMAGDSRHGQENIEEDSVKRKGEKEGGPGERQENSEAGNDEMGVIGAVTLNEYGGATGHEEHIPTFRSCIFSKIFLTQLFWISIIQFRLILFIGTLNPMLTQAANGDALQVSRLTNAFAITQLFGIFTAPWNGLIMDRHRRRTVSSLTVTAPVTSQRLADMNSVVLSLAVTVTLGVLFSIFATIPVLEVQYLTFVLHVITRSFLFGGLSAFITIAFPPCHFGKLFGLTQAISACVSLLQYPCFTLVQGPLQRNPLYLNIGLILLVTLTYVHPIIVYLHCRREMEKRGVVNHFQVEVSQLEE